MAINKHWIKISVAILVFGFFVYGFWPEPMVVDLSKATTGPLTVFVEEEGKTRVIDRFVVSAPITAYARRVVWEVGDEVQHNDVLVSLEPLRSSILDPRSRAEAEARVEAAEAFLQSAEQNAKATKADLDYKKSEVERKEILQKAKTISIEELDLAISALRRIEAQYRSAKFAVEVAKFKLAEAQKALDYSSNVQNENDIEKHLVRSPIDGRVLKISHKSEGVVKIGEPLIELGDPTGLEIEVDVLSEDAVKIHPGTKVYLERWGGQGRLEGVVKTVEPIGFTKISALGVEEQRVLVIANITSPYSDWKKLGDGYRVDASFVIWESDGVLTVPTSSLFRKKDQWLVFKNQNNKAHLQEVEVGQSNGIRTQIMSGLTEGDIVITFPDANIKPLQSIKARVAE